MLQQGTRPLFQCDFQPAICGCRFYAQAPSQRCCRQLQAAPRLDALQHAASRLPARCQPPAASESVEHGLLCAAELEGMLHGLQLAIVLEVGGVVGRLDVGPAVQQRTAAAQGRARQYR